MVYPAKNRPNSSLNQSGIGENRPYPDWVTLDPTLLAPNAPDVSSAGASRAGVFVISSQSPRS